MATHYVARELAALGHDVKQVPPALTFCEDAGADKRSPWRSGAVRIERRQFCGNFATCPRKVT
jgi:hypothetical protein